MEKLQKQEDSPGKWDLWLSSLPACGHLVCFLAFIFLWASSTFCPSSGPPRLLPKTSLMATSLGHRGKQGAAVWFPPEAAEREEPLPAGHQPLGPAEVLPAPELEQAQVSLSNCCSEGGDGRRGARNKALENTPDTGMGWPLMKLEENPVSAPSFCHKDE